MSTDPPIQPNMPAPTGTTAPEPLESAAEAGHRRGPRGWLRLLAGPVLVVVLLIGAVAYPLLNKNAPADEGPCRRRPETVAALRAEAVFTQHPKSADLGIAGESFSCKESSPSTSVLTSISSAVVGRRLTTSMTPAEVRAYYAGLAERTGWQSERTPVGLYSATKPAGDCPWWFVVIAGKHGYSILLHYQPIGATDCEWKTGRPMIIPLSD